MENLFEQDFLDKPITELSVSGLISIINKVNSTTVLAELHRINTEINNTKVDIKNLHDANENSEKEFNELKKHTNSKITALEEGKKQSQALREQMCQVMKNHQQTIDSLEYKKRECNVIIRGIPEEDPPNEEEDIRILYEVMSKIDVHDGFLPKPKRLGKVNNTSRIHRAILLEFESKDQVNSLIGKAKHLAELPAEDPLRKCYIQRDLPPSVREANYKLRSQLKVERAKTENAEANLKLDYKSGTITRTIGREEVVIFILKHPF